MLCVTAKYVVTMEATIISLSLSPATVIVRTINFETIAQIFDLDFTSISIFFDEEPIDCYIHIEYE